MKAGIHDAGYRIQDTSLGMHLASSQFLVIICVIWGVTKRAKQIQEAF